MPGRRRRWDNFGEPLFGEDWWVADQKLFEDSLIRQQSSPPAPRRRPRRTGTIRKRNRAVPPGLVQDMLPGFGEEQGADDGEPVRGDGPQALEVRAESFADSRDGEASCDLAIGNVPFGNMVLHDRRHNPAGHSIHNHFIVKALHLVRPGGLVAVLTSRFTMDARNPAARREIASLADLLGAIRLPGGAHQRAAGTSVITDLLVLRRREPGRAPDAAAWEKSRHAELDGVQVPVNEYFLDHPDAVLGHMGAVHGTYRADDLAVRPSGDTITAFSAALDALITSARQRGLAHLPADRAAKPPRSVVPEAAQSDQPDGYLRARLDGTFTRVVFGAEQPHAVPASQAAELAGLLALRDSARASYRSGSCRSSEWMRKRWLGGNG